MEWFLNIPKILHVYWGTGSLPYLRYRTVSSFLQYNPDWKVILWRPRYPAKVVTWHTRELQYKSNWADYTESLVGTVSEVIEVDFADHGISNSISEVHKSDFLRYWFLHKYGGVYADMDVLFFRPIEKLEVNRPHFKDRETFVCISPKYGHSIGFLMASPGSKYFQRMEELSKVAFKDPKVYQCIGPNLCNKYFPTLQSIKAISPAAEIGMRAVYAHDGRRVKELYAEPGGERFTSQSIGVHWYAGHPLAGEFLRSTDGGRINLPNSIIGRL